MFLCCVGSILLGVDLLQKSQIFDLLNKNLVFFLATVEGTEPRVRGMMLYRADESGIIFHTGPQKRYIIKF